MEILPRKPNTVMVTLDRFEELNKAEIKGKMYKRMYDALKAGKNG